MSEERDLRLAVLIDADNAPRSALGDVMAEVAVYGTPTIKRIYGDWTTPNLASWKPLLLENAITPVQQYGYTTGKNSTDSAMIIDEDARGLYRKAMAAFGGIAPSYHIELLDKPTIYWDFHSLLLGIQMMFSFMLVDGDQPLRLCKHCQKVFLGSRSNAAFCSPRCKNQYNVYKSRSKKGGNEEE